jgi:hypothetical protein
MIMVVVVMVIATMQRSQPASSQPASHSILASQRAGSTQVLEGPGRGGRCEASPLRA